MPPISVSSAWHSSSFRPSDSLPFMAPPLLRKEAAGQRRLLPAASHCALRGLLVALRTAVLASGLVAVALSRSPGAAHALAALARLAARGLAALSAARAATLAARHSALAAGHPTLALRSALLALAALGSAPALTLAALPLRGLSLGALAHVAALAAPPALVVGILGIRHGFL